MVDVQPRGRRAPRPLPPSRRRPTRRVRLSTPPGPPLVLGLVVGLTVGLLVGGARGESEAPPPPAPAVVAPPPVTAAPVVLSQAEPANGRWVALTFDDGPDPQYTPEILALLRRHDAVATFCMVGSEIAGNEALIRKVVAAGMRLCSHSHTHDEQLGTRTLDRITSEIVGTQQRLAHISGEPVPYYRAPGGNWSPVVLEVAAAHGMQPVGWSVDTGDWRQLGVDAIVTTVQRDLLPGGVVLLHDGGGNRDQTVDALARLLPRLVEQGTGSASPPPVFPGLSRRRPGRL